MYLKNITLALLVSLSVLTSAAAVAENNQVSASTKKITEKVNINTANSNTLAQVQGLGKTKAQAIVDFREKNGEFDSVDSLTDVKGIGKRAVEKLKEQLTTG